MLTYFHVLELIADREGLDLKAAFQAAGLPTSTYYRAKHGTDLHYGTAARVWQQLTGETPILMGIQTTNNSEAAVDVNNAA
jgi:predicted transcriptional regulator